MQMHAMAPKRKRRRSKNRQSLSSKDFSYITAQQLVLLNDVTHKKVTYLMFLSVYLFNDVFRARYHLLMGQVVKEL